MTFMLEALRDFCTRCEGRHSTTFHFPRKIAANALGRGETVADAAKASRMPLATVNYWSTSDAEFRAQVEASSHKAIMRTMRRLNRAAQALVAETREGGSAA